MGLRVIFNLPQSKLHERDFFSLSLAGVAQLVRASACRHAAFPSKGGLKLSGISVKAKSLDGVPSKAPRYANTEGTPYTKTHSVGAP